MLPLQPTCPCVDPNQDTSLPQAHAVCAFLNRVFFSRSSFPPFLLSLDASAPHPKRSQPCRLWGYRLFPSLFSCFFLRSELVYWDDAHFVQNALSLAVLFLSSHRIFCFLDKSGETLKCSDTETTRRHPRDLPCLQEMAKRDAVIRNIMLFQSNGRSDEISAPYTQKHTRKSTSHSSRHSSLVAYATFRFIRHTARTHLDSGTGSR